MSDNGFSKGMIITRSESSMVHDTKDSLTSKADPLKSGSCKSQDTGLNKRVIE